MATAGSSSASGKGAASGETATSTPVFVDLGKKKNKLVKQLKKGKGKLVDTIEDTIKELREEGKIKNEVQPVVVLIRRQRRGKGRFMRLPIL